MENVEMQQVVDEDHMPENYKLIMYIVNINNQFLFDDATLVGNDEEEIDYAREGFQCYEPEDLHIPNNIVWNYIWASARRIVYLDEIGHVPNELEQHVIINLEQTVAERKQPLILAVHNALN
jgi:hypothetical protein